MNNAAANFAQKLNILRETCGFKTILSQSNMNKSLRSVRFTALICGNANPCNLSARGTKLKKKQSTNAK